MKKRGVALSYLEVQEQRVETIICWTCSGVRVEEDPVTAG
jgi:hypothetical protein